MRAEEDARRERAKPAAEHLSAPRSDVQHGRAPEAPALSSWGVAKDTAVADLLLADIPVNSPRLPRIEEPRPSPFPSRAQPQLLLPFSNHPAPPRLAIASTRITSLRYNALVV
ncbi:hypothetical protein B5807_00870 [Epicoccum nigrum]|jgi:hypothetical protein|uniref:Uncharacterized protein n=1 Tax=Epicoccum nigrum TaxID=105696 RepID=A0A1Y2MIK2_EPING|nr:hypothetical protein B5807_00870 [Epicoccum nigrum]